MVVLDLCKKGIKPNILHLLQERFYPSQVRPTFPYGNLDVIQWYSLEGFVKLLAKLLSSSWYDSIAKIASLLGVLQCRDVCLLGRPQNKFEIPSNSTNQETPLNWCIMYDALRHHDVSLDFDGMVRLLARGCSTPLWDEIGCACSRLDHVR